jgi:hypothetical protein
MRVDEHGRLTRRSHRASSFDSRGERWASVIARLGCRGFGDSEGGELTDGLLLDGRQICESEAGPMWGVTHWSAMASPLPQPLILRFLDQQVQKQGYLKVIAAPLTGLAAAGTILAVLGNNWLLFGTVVGGGTCLLTLLLLTTERIRSATLIDNISQLQADMQAATVELEQKTQQNTSAIEQQGVEIEALRELVESARWATERMAVCCSASRTNGVSARRMTIQPEDVCHVKEFDDLESAVLQYAFELLGSGRARRLVIYYGDEKRLEPAHKTGWPRTNPRVLVAAQPTMPLEVNATALFDALRNNSELYVPDVTIPSQEHRSFVDIVPDHQEFRTLAVFRLASLPSVWAKNDARASILGALLVHDARAGALDNSLARDFLAVLANVLATGFLAVRLGLANGGID